MRVIHVAPTGFGPDGLYGGGERYPLELARALAAEVDCELVTFGRRPGRWREDGGLAVRVLRPLTWLGGHPAQPVAPLLPAGLLGAPPERTEVIYGGADTRRFAPVPGAGRGGVLFVGRLTPHKGIDRLLEALPAGAALRVAGSAGHDPRPPERDYPDLLRRLAQGRDVSFLGPVPDAALPALYRQATVLALPSVERTCYGRPVPVSELLGLVALEAMASGTPVVASRLGGLAEVVVDGETGFLVPPGDTAALGDRLARLVGDRRLAARLGANARDHVLARFTWRACAERCLAAYQALTRSPAPRPR